MMSMDPGACDDTDLELVCGMLANDRRAWRLFLQRYERLIFAAINRVLCRFPDYSTVTDREEIYATLLSSLVARDMHKLRAFDFRRGSRLSTWISMMATHATWDYLRSAARTPRGTLALDAEALEADTACPLNTVLAREDCERVADALGAMSPREREFVQLFYLEDNDAAEVAMAMNISVHTVYTKRFKLKVRLEQALDA
jgi:RNA polymerase sigma-70 factor, ECF subfamily